MKEAISIDDQMLEQIFSIGSEIQRTGYLRNLWLEFYTTLSLILQYRSHSSAAVRYGLDLVLRRKAITIEAWQAERVASERGDDPARIPLVNALQHSRAADRKAVARALPGGSALVEFVRIGVVDFEAVPARGESKLATQPRYLAFVLPAGRPDKVWMIDVGEAEPIEKMVTSFRASITGEAEQAGDRGVKPPLVEPNGIPVHSDESDLRTAILATRHARLSSKSEDGGDGAIIGAALRQALFDPLVPAIGTCKRLFIAPDGELTRLPFEVLPGSDGGHMIDDYQISYLGVGRDVLRFEAEPTVQPEPPLVAADPDFDLQAISERGPSATVTPFERLDGTRLEGERIAELLEVVPLLGPRVLEKHIKGRRSPRILHLATHGYFLPDAPRDPSNEQVGLVDRGESKNGWWARLTGLENSFLRSGLALAGANTWLRGGELPEEAEDAMLNAEDVTTLDLRATELVVLSACETGLGHVQVGEGVFGLRDSFLLAGAKTLVMSLWKVRDVQTQELMEDFYRRLLEGQPRAEALRDAQLAMKERYPDPFYWGAFICLGDPGPLPQ